MNASTLNAMQVLYPVNVGAAIGRQRATDLSPTVSVSDLRSNDSAFCILHSAFCVLPRLSLRGAKRRGNLPVQCFHTAAHSDEWYQEIAPKGILFGPTSRCSS